MEIVEINVDDIIVGDDRYRKDMGDVQSLADSIKCVGQLIPIMVTKDMKLIAGERRVRACKLAGIKTVKAMIVDVDDINQKVYELTENLERKDFTWQERVKALKELHRLLSETNKDWSERKTAMKVGLSVGGVVTDLNLADALEEAPELFEGIKTKESALKVLQKYKIDETIAEIKLRAASKAVSDEVARRVWQGDCIDLIDRLPDKSVDAVITDPFYGINIEDASQSLEPIYKDTPELFLDTVTRFIKKLPRVLKDDAVVVWFCAWEHSKTVHNLLSEIGLDVATPPAVWVRPLGQTNSPATRLASCHEMIIYAFKGNSAIQTQGKNNVFVYPHVSFADKVHPVQKPFNLMMDIIDTFCTVGQVVLDPFAGSGTTLIAAIKKGCIPIGFELDRHYYMTCVDRVMHALKLKHSGKADLIGKESPL